MALNIYYKLPFAGLKRVNSDSTDIKSVYKIIRDRESFDDQEFKLVQNGKFVTLDNEIKQNSILHVHFPLVGGKGGFGSMLRAIGAQIEKTTNREACRDLSGRRLRHINEEKRIKKWIAKETERKKEAEKKKQARLERLRSQPKCEFRDEEYEKNRTEIPESVGDAVQYGLKLKHSKKVETKGEKRKLEVKESDVKKKKTNLWLGVDDLEESDEDEDRNSPTGTTVENSNNDFQPCCSKTL